MFKEYCKDESLSVISWPFITGEFFDQKRISKEQKNGAHRFSSALKVIPPGGRKTRSLSDNSGKVGVLRASRCKKPTPRQLLLVRC